MIEATSQALTIFGISVPTVVWASISSAIIASGITFSGVLFTNWNSRKQLEATLEHETTQKDREREMSLRKDVYLKSAEAIYWTSPALVDTFDGRIVIKRRCVYVLPEIFRRV